MRNKENGHTLANRVRLLQQNSTHRQAVLIVEGDKDSSFFHSFINNGCKIRYANSKENVLIAIQDLNKTNTKGVIGIVDADFDRIKITPIQIESNIFLTDTHDLESMCIKSPALDKIIIKFLTGDDRDKKDSIVTLLRKRVLDLAISIGYIRNYVINNKLPIGFKDLDIGKYIDRNMQLDILKLINDAISHPTQISITVEQIRDRAYEAKRLNYDEWQICHGKDMLKIIKRILPIIIKQAGCKIRANKYLLDENLTISLIEAYESSFFITTELYKSILEWEVNNQPNKIFNI